MKVKYAVTFEFDTAPPVTFRGTIAASGMPTCVARAAKAAMKAHPGLKWSSVVVVLLERQSEATDELPESLDITRTVVFDREAPAGDVA